MHAEHDAQPVVSKRRKFYLILSGLIMGLGIFALAEYIPGAGFLVFAALFLLVLIALGCELVAGIIRKRRPCARPVVAFVIASLVMVPLSLLSLRGYQRYRREMANTKARSERILCKVGHARILAACREVMGQWRDYRPYPGWPGPVPDEGTYLSLWDESLPAEIRSLRPGEIYARDDRVYLKIEAGPFGFGVRAFAEGVKGHGDEEIIDGLWYYFIEKADWYRRFS